MQLYVKYKPCPELEKSIDCFFVYETDMLSPSLMTPYGCMSIVFNMGDNVQTIQEGETNPKFLPRSFLFGQISGVQKWQPVGKFKLLTVRFLPHAFSLFFNVPAHEFDNQLVPLDFLFDSSVKKLEEEVFLAKNVETAIRHIELFLISKTQMDMDRYNSLKVCYESIKLITESAESFSIKELAAKFDITPRRLEQIYSEHVGLSPKAFSRIKRINKIVHKIQSTPPESLTDFALQHGFYDQAHFNKEFKSLTGRVPTELIKVVERNKKFNVSFGETRSRKDTEK